MMDRMSDRRVTTQSNGKADRDTFKVEWHQVES